MNRWIMAIWVASAGVIGVVSTADAGDFTIPAAWEGVWNISEVERECGTTGGFPSQEPDTLCAGDPVFDEPLLNCTGTITDTNVDISCETSESTGFPDFPDCMVTFSFSLVANRTGDSYTATNTLGITYTDCPGLLEDECTELVTTGTRTAADPDCEGLPVLPATWTEIKAVF
jgi:hypothetical protein